MSSVEISRAALTMRTGAYDKFRELLAELFMFNQPELDFGIYRIMAAKRDEISRFLDSDLLPQVKEALGSFDADRRAGLERDLEQAVRAASHLGVTLDTSPKVQELRRQLADTNVAAIDEEVFSHLYNFFRRYYDSGDFIAQRRYKPGVYAIPYEGEEVKLHWATRDQYYIKTTEHLRDYDFQLRPEDATHPMRVHFRLSDAVEGEHGNVKSQQEQERIFILADHDFILETDGELTIRFEYRPGTKNDWPTDVRDENKKLPAQKDLISIAAKRILSVSDTALMPWIAELGKRHQSSDGQASETTRLEVHLKRYTARNKFDYFIHKDLGSFLRRELDFFIKNEVVHLDDVDSTTASAVGSNFAKVKAIRRIAVKVIDFLSQLEDFEKKLWLKKKFVAETHYCIPLTQIPETFYADIADNRAQHAEWMQLHNINDPSDFRTVLHTVPLTFEYLKANRTLALDTRHFSKEFTDRLLSTFSDLDEVTDGLLFHGDNFQALYLLEERYRGALKCIYIDPPYNTGNDGFVYKDNYQHSSWLSMMSQTLPLARTLLSPAAAFFVSCDDNEAPRLRQCLDADFGAQNLEAQIIVQSNKRGQTYKSIAKTHEYLLAYDADATTQLNGIPRDVEEGEEDIFGHYELWELRNRNPKFGRFNRPNLFFPIYVSPAQYEKDGYSCVSVVETTEFKVPVLPRNSAGEDSCWRWQPKTVQEASASRDRILIAKQTRSGEWRIWEKARKSFKAPKSIWADSDVINEKGTVELGALGLKDFGFPKPLGLLDRVTQIGMSDGDTILDYFAGTGTTGHAVINKNREDGGQRKFILVEVGDHFTSVLLPRMKKVIFTPDWKDGKPARAATEEETERSPRLIKIIRLESYEDTLNNLELKRTAHQSGLLDAHLELREDYLLRYMLDVETKGSGSLLNIRQFEDPFHYSLQLRNGGLGEARPTTVDLIETFNWMLGLKVKQVGAKDGFRIVKGTDSAGASVLVIWRNTSEKLTADLDSFFQQQGYAHAGFDIIYVNGDNNLENLRQPSEKWHVRLIEEHFKRLMFGAGVQG